MWMKTGWQGIILVAEYPLLSWNAIRVGNLRPDYIIL